MPASPEKFNLASMDVAADKQRLLRQLFPETFTETTDETGADRPALDFEKPKRRGHSQITDIHQIQEPERENPES